MEEDAVLAQVRERIAAGEDPLPDVSGKLLAEGIGGAAVDDVLDRLFSSFCIGK